MPKAHYDVDFYIASDDDSLEGVFVVGTGENDGEFLFQYHPTTGEAPSTISAIIVDLEKYPTDHEVFVFGCGEHAETIGEKLSDMESLSGKTVSQILTSTSLHLRNKESSGSGKRPFVANNDDRSDMRDTPMLDAGPLQSPRGAWGPRPMDIDDDLYSLPSSPVPDKGKRPAPKARPPNRIVSDLRAAKDAGFKVGYHGSLKGTGVCYLIVSCRLSRLGISDGALDAWHVEHSRYLSLIIEYPSGYANLEELWDGKKRGRWSPKKASVRMKIRQGDKYKPSRSACQAAFKNEGSSNDLPHVFKGLETLLNERLLFLLRQRWDHGYSWNGAEEMYFEKDGKYKSAAAMPAAFWHDDTYLGGFSRLVNSDHFQDAPNPFARSFPLVAMQFLLRRFARHADFCLVCHRMVNSDVEVLEPYVCSTPACLHKYLSSDFGPGIEKDLVEQPYVVDLLVSFCYASAKHQRLKDFPDALGLKVPNPPGSGGAYSGTFDRTTKELTLRINATNPISYPVQVGTWMTITGAGAAGETLCCRAIDMSSFPIIRVSDPISTIAQASALNVGTAYTGQSAIVAGSQQVQVDLFNRDFASLTPQMKQQCICLLLDTLPSVREMKDRLRLQHISSWGDRISPAALGVLRWIVASNRACIVQVDGLETGSNGVFPATQTEDRVYGMGNWMQFRFAMGAPDKEQRFVTATAGAQRRLRLTYPTLFAWHGSPLVNWHSIIREGLNFNQTAHGRAYGNGCYHSLDFTTSSGYTGTHANASDQWTKSVLKVSAAVALNEIINAPNEFVSRSPHLVVAQLDWIQTRYLFVQCAFSSQTTVVQKQPSQVKPQDPTVTPNGAQGKIIIPQPKAARARKDELIAENSKGKKSEQFITVVIDGIEEQIPVEEDPGSDRTNDSDLDELVGESADSQEADDLEAAIALSMEGSAAKAPVPMQAESSRRRSWFSGFGKVPMQPEYQPVVAGASASTSTAAGTSASASTSTAAGTSASASASTSTVAGTSATASSSTAAGTSATASSSAGADISASAGAGARGSAGKSSAEDDALPSYDEVPVAATTSVTSTSAAGAKAAGASASNNGGTSEPPRYYLRSASTSTASSSSSTLQSPQPTIASSSTSVSSGSGSQSTTGGFFEVRKGKAAASAAPPSTPIVTGPIPRAAPVVAPIAPPAAANPAPAPTLVVARPVISTPAPAPIPIPQAPKVPLTDFVAGELDYRTLPLIAQPTFATHAATKRLQKEFRSMLKTQESTPLHELGWYTNPDHFDNVYQWIVELHTFDSTLPLAVDMKASGVKSVVLELRFGGSFPATPPFVRVIKPRFLPFLSGGGGHVTAGGAVCLEMLTGTGWDSKTTIESVLMNVRLAMMSKDPRPAKLEPGSATSSYGVSEAVQAYLRACRTHGWVVPKGFEDMANATR